MTAPIDQSRAVRQGEELNIARLADYLKAHLPDSEGDLVVEQFPAGHSNLTYLIRLGERDLVLRRPPFGANIKTAHDMGREYRILSGLINVYPKVPRPLIYCEDESVLGAPFYAMERLSGVVLRAKPPEGLALTPEVMRGLSMAFIDNLADLHGLDTQAAGLGDLGKPAGYVTRQITGWTERYHNARTDDVPDIERAAGWLADHMPAESGAALIHNDYKYDNLVLDPADITRIIGVLDWEMATVGDPLMDLGTTLGYWIDPDDPDELHAASFGLTALPGNLSRAELAEHYAARTGRELPDLLFYYVYALFKLAVIVQQIYARYKKGLTQDERFAPLIMMVYVLGKTAVRAIELGRINGLR